MWLIGRDGTFAFAFAGTAYVRQQVRKENDVHLRYVLANGLGSQG